VLDVARELSGRGTIVDVTSTDDVDRWVDGEPEAYALVTAAGICRGRLLPDSGDDEWHELLNTNLLGSMRVLRAFARLRVAAGGGGVALLIASNNAFWPGRSLSAYCASKAGVVMLGRCAATELGVHGIRVNILAPGETETPMIQPVLERDRFLRDEIIRRTPLGRVGLPRDVANAARSLLLDDAAWVTGQLLSADGGVTLRGEPDATPIR
jgi:NAD(P)-dependent dehydrogenase (short-subunit alcohol dehydrogenase family)